MRSTILYQATNLQSGKKYIGITVRALDVRRRRHMQDARSGSALPFHRALLKNGPDGFEWKTLAVLQSQKDAAETEVRAIAVFKPEYNSHPGGALGPYPPNPDTIKRIAEAHFKSVVCLNTGAFFKSMKEANLFCGRSVGAVVSGREITANGLSFVRADGPIPFEECKRLLRKLLERKSNRYAKSTVARSKPVVCLTNGERYKSASSAGRALAVSGTSIGECCRGLIHHTGGMKFVFESDYKAGRFDPDSKKKTNIKCRRVVCTDTGIIYESVSAAAKAHGTQTGNVILVCAGKRRIAGGVSFQYDGIPVVVGPSRKKATLTADNVRAIRAEIGTTPQQVLAARYGVSHQTIFDIKRRRSWKDLV